MVYGQAQATNQGERMNVNICHFEVQSFIFPVDTGLAKIDSPIEFFLKFC